MNELLGLKNFILGLPLMWTIFTIAAIIDIWILVISMYLGSKFLIMVFFGFGFTLLAILLSCLAYKDFG